MSKSMTVDGIELVTGERLFQDLDPRPVNERINGIYKIAIGDINAKKEKSKSPRKNIKIISP